MGWELHGTLRQALSGSCEDVQFSIRPAVSEEAISPKSIRIDSVIPLQRIDAQSTHPAFGVSVDLIDDVTGSVMVWLDPRWRQQMGDFCDVDDLHGTVRVTAIPKDSGVTGALTSNLNATIEIERDVYIVPQRLTFGQASNACVAAKSIVLLSRSGSSFKVREITAPSEFVRVHGNATANGVEYYDVVSTGVCSKTSAYPVYFLIEEETGSSYRVRLPVTVLADEGARAS
jgi:hypothetical protein